MDTFRNLNDSIYLSEINVTGTHDSCTAFVSMENMARCQNLTVQQQLEMGVRLFDIRLNKKNNEFYLVHAIADCFTDESKQQKLVFSQVLDTFVKFLEENPEETLIVSVKQDRGIMSRSFFPAFYEKYIKGNESRWLLKNQTPTLGEARGKMVLMRRCKVWKGFLESVDAGLDFSRWPDQKSKSTKVKTVYLDAGISGKKASVLKAQVQDRYCLACKTKWHDCAKVFLDSCVTDKNLFALHYISTSYRKKGETLVQTAEEMNSLFGKYELRKDKAQGWFFLDFPTNELCEKIIKSNSEIYKGNDK